MATATYQSYQPYNSSLHNGHGRLHRRATSSLSLSTSTFASPTLGNATFSSQSDLSTLNYAQRLPPLPPLITRPTAPRRKMSYEEYFDEYTARAASPAHGGSSFKIKPYLRKMSLKDDMRIDLSKPAAENESLTGISMGQDPHSALSARSATEPNFPPVSRRGHGRSGSNTSQYSVSSALQRPTAPYAPMRATPRPFTPPIAKSANASTHELTVQDEDMTAEELRYQQNVLEQIQRRGSASSTIAPPKLHQTRSTSSLSRHNNNASQSSLALNSNPTIPLGPNRSRGNTLRSSETTGSSRPSFDKTFTNLLRSVKSDEPVDPTERAASRAASIRAARQAYYEREHKKDQKEDEKQMKRRSKEEKRLKRRRAKSDAVALEELRQETRVKKGRKSTGSSAVASVMSRSQPQLSTFDEKASRSSAGLVSRAYDATTSSSMPAMGDEPLPSFNEKSFHSNAADVGARAAYAGKRSGAGGKASKDRWLSFMAWFRTRLLRMSDNINHH